MANDNDGVTLNGTSSGNVNDHDDYDNGKIKKTCNKFIQTDDISWRVIVMMNIRNIIL